MSQLDVSQFQYPVVYCNHLRDFYSKIINKNSSFSIKISSNQRLDIEITYKGTSDALVLLAGAKTMRRMKTPNFSGRLISESIDKTTIRISDPVFYLNDDFKLGWYFGSDEFNLQKSLPIILNNIKDVLHIETYSFFGGSGGGCASLYFSSKFEDSTAIVFNPQTNIVLYPADRFNVIEKYAREAFNTTRNKLHEKINTDLCKLYAGCNQKNKIIYMQNITDSHSNRDCKPFVEAFGVNYPGQCFSGLISENFYLHLTDWSKGHKPPPKESLLYVLKKIVNDKVIFSEENLKFIFKQAELLGI